MSAQSEAEHKLAQIIVESLDLEDVSAEDIGRDDALFGAGDPNGLGLDSIDALEIALAVAQNYGIQIKAEDESYRAIFTSLRTLTDYISSQT